MANDVKNVIVSNAAKLQHDRRRQREPRFPLAIEIEVSGIDRSGQPFYENALTSNVSMSGCRFTLSRQLEKDTIVAIRVLRTLSGRPADPRLVMFQIIYTQQKKEGWATGAWTLQPDIEWCTDIPSGPEPGKDDLSTSPPTSNFSQD
jgi:hypothetical protein